MVTLALIVTMNLNISNTFSSKLPADINRENRPRVVTEATHSFVMPSVPIHPKLVHASEVLANAIGLSKADINSSDFLNVFSGTEVYAGTKPYAMAYGGHQFGHWAGQLGDGRAINLFEILHNQKRWVFQLKGAGPTPYSRRGDGFAVLRSSIREYLCSEAMHHLGVPTTRALSLMLSGNDVLRDMLYNGNAAYEKGAIVCRVAPSFIRFGNFELFAARQDLKHLTLLTDYTISHFYAALGKPSKDTYVNFFRAVTQRTLDLIIHWQRVGFVHGVMNTDNMSILGLTIDYGPYGWLEGFDFNWTPNTTDAENKRYRYGNQPNIALWNLLQLANALYPLVEDTAPFEAILKDYKTQFDIKFLHMMRQKLGLTSKEDNDTKLVETLENCLLTAETDMTIFFRLLSNFKKSNANSGLELLKHAIYNPKTHSEDTIQLWQHWFEIYSERLKREPLNDSERQQLMHKVNPKYVLRNYMAQLAIDAADRGNYDLIDELFQVLKQPYNEQPHYEKWFAKRPDWAKHKVGCSMLSCSS